MTCSAMPVQIEGRLKDGRRFYFRARFETVWLGVGETLDDAVGATLLAPYSEHCVERDLSDRGEYMAGMIEPAEAWALLREMAAELPDRR